MYCVLFYDYVDNVVERRAPFREAHLTLAKDWVKQGRLLLGGAFAEPVDGGLLVFKVGEKAEVEDFVRNDPYVKNGIVTSWKVRPWTVVVGSAM